MRMLQYCCFTSILCLRHQEGQVGPDPQVVEIIFVNCLTTKQKEFFWHDISATLQRHTSVNSVNMQRNKPLYPVCFVFPVEVRGELDSLFVCLFVCFFHKWCVHMQVNKTKFERNLLLSWVLSHDPVYWKNKIYELKRSIIYTYRRLGVFIQIFDIYVPWSLSRLRRNTN